MEKMLLILLKLNNMKFYIAHIKSFSAKYLIILIAFLSLIINFYNISNVPPSLSWDEASVGYDAWSIVMNGKDQWSEAFPVAFQSFGEIKYPFHIYTTSAFIKFFGAINVVILFFLTRFITKNEKLALLTSLLLVICPWFINFSRVNWETNFALAFFLTGLLIFFHGIEKSPKIIPLAFIFFGLDLYTYNAAKLFIPIFVIFLCIIYCKELFKNLWISSASVFIFVLILCFGFLNPKLSGLTRFQQVSFNDELVKKTITYKITKNHYIGRGEIVFKNYLSHFNPQFLFISGDINPRHSSQLTGELYWSDLLLLPLGLLALFKLRKKYGYLIIVWFFLAPLPASIVNEVPHASRSMFALGGWQIVSSFGIYYLLRKIHKNFRKIVILLLALFIMASFLNYLYGYFNIYPKKYADVWQYGYKKIFTDYRDTFKNYDHVIITDRYNQPYIFALYYLRYPLSEFRSEVVYNKSIRKETSVVESFNHFIFTDINFYNLPKGKSLIFASPTDKMDELTPKNLLLNPDGSISIYVYEYEK